MRATTRFGFLCALAFGAACGIDTHPGATCDDDNPCPLGQDCYRGFCVAEGCDEGMTRPCYTGSEDTLGVGRCMQGTQTCVDGVFGACLGQQIPQLEECNDTDDDCDGRTDEIDGTECDTRMPGVCSVGTLECVDGGMGAVCTPTTPASEERCNSRDDDCDTRVDEGLEGDSCYPADTMGCTPDGGGGFACVGACQTGTFQCVDEDVRECVGAIVPSTDPDGCTADGETAVDDDCDGDIDEDCPCDDGETQACYGGPAGTAGVGPCMMGEQTCVANRFGACEGAVLPEPETCGNEGTDNNCDGMMDNVPMRGMTCSVEGNVGVCASGVRECDGPVLGCSTPDPSDELCNELDDDCDGSTDETFDTTNDPANCGTCGTTCENDCCDGACTNVRLDEGNCGACAADGGATCADGEECCGGTCNAPALCAGCAEDCAASGTTCCSMECVDTQSDENNCGGCGVTCGAGQFCCGGTCTDESVDSCGQGCNTCGDDQLCCNNACVDQGAEFCGGCMSGCGSTCCAEDHDGTCVNLQNDPTNCGGCGVNCAPTDTCSNGMCCGAGLTNCGGSCTDTQTDDDNCGSCGRECGLGCGLLGTGARVCRSGACVCP